MTARRLDVNHAAYLSDPCERPSLSQSIAHTLVTRSPLHAWSQHPRLGAAPREPSKETDEAEIIHSLLLGKGGQVEILKFDNYRTKDAQTQRDAAREAGRVPLLERQYEGIVTASTAIVQRLAERGIVLDGESEVAIEWEEPSQYGPVLCRGKLDHLKRPQIIDVKKILSADPGTCAAHVARYGYDIQDAAYTSAVQQLHPELAGRTDFLFVFVEIEPPYDVNPVRLDAVFKARGKQRWERAKNLWAMCLRDNRWPGYSQGIGVLDAPGWMVAQMETEAQHDV